MRNAVYRAQKEFRIGFIRIFSSSFSENLNDLCHYYALSHPISSLSYPIIIET